MENASTGQMRSSNPPPGCGAGCARVRRSRFGVWPHGKAHSAQPVGFRMRLLVRCAGRMRFCVRQADVCAGEERHILRKSAFCNRCLTEKRTLRLRRYGKPQSATLRCDGDSLLDHCRHGQLQFNSRVSFRPSCAAVPQPTPPVFGSAYSTNPRLPKRVCSLFGSHLASTLCA